jgi:carbamoyl-phosphate synthase large subunit
MKKTILFSSAGRRNQLIGCFRQDALELGIELHVLAADLHPALSPACRAADAAFEVPRCTAPEFAARVLDLCAREQVDLVIPTIDTELPIYAAHIAQFAQVGTKVIVSSPATVALARNKFETARWLGQVGVPTPRTVWWDHLRADPSQLRWPVIVKPNDGSGSVGIHRLHDPELCQDLPLDAHLIAQECLQGTEFTINLFVDRHGVLQTAIPHERLEIRSGEVSKGITRRMPALEEMGRRIAGNLPGAEGPLCFQAIVDPQGLGAVFEINARFGGGYPLAHRAGAKFSRWLLEEATVGTSGANDRWKEGVLMLRHDDAIFIDA